MRRAESNKTLSPTTIFPASGRTSPERQSSNVDFPAPEGPNKMVMPGGASTETSRMNDESARRFFRTHATSVRGFTWRSIVSMRGPTRGG